MTITLTVEEVKNYVSAMEHWQSRRADEVARLVLNQLDPFLDRASLKMAVATALAKWDAANPMPTLISSHFGALVPKVTEQQKPTTISKG